MARKTKRAKRRHDDTNADQESVDAQQPLWDFSSRDEHLLQSGSFSDAEVVCGDRVWKVHKAIICTRSEYFEKAFTSGFQETDTGKIVIHEQHPDQINWLITCIYTGKATPDLLKLLQGENTFMMTCLEAFKVADYFCFDGLQHLIAHWLEKRLQEEVSSFQGNSFIDRHTGCLRYLEGGQHCSKNGEQIQEPCRFCKVPPFQPYLGQSDGFSRGFVDDFTTLAGTIYASRKPSPRLHQVFLDFFALTRCVLLHAEEIRERIEDIPILAASLCSLLAVEQRQRMVSLERAHWFPGQCFECGEDALELMRRNKVVYKKLRISYAGELRGSCESCA